MFKDQNQLLAIANQLDAEMHDQDHVRVFVCETEEGEYLTDQDDQGDNEDGDETENALIQPVGIQFGSPPPSGSGRYISTFPCLLNFTFLSCFC